MSMVNLWWLGIILIVPLCWSWVSKLIWPHEITYKEMGIHFAITLVVTGIVYSFCMFGKSADVEVWNGEVTSKKRLEVSCEHSYDCMCVTVSCGENCTTEVCQTCYDHSYDVDWRVYSNVQDTTNISRIDRQGLKEPPRWTQVQIGEPYSDAKLFENYIKGAPDSIFNDKDLITKFESLIPKYPNKIYDYYKVNRVLSVGVPIKGLPQWNKELSERLKVLGPKRKSNVVIVMAKTNDIQYAKALKEAWLGGKKNDTVIVFGITNYPKIDFVDMFSWSKNKAFDVELLDSLRQMGEVDRTKVLDTISTQVMKNFQKRSMEEYSYLADDAVPSDWMLMLIFGISIITSAVTSYFTVTNTERVYRRRW